MCPNFLRAVFGLMTLDKEEMVNLAVIDLARLGYVKRNSKQSPSTFYLTKAPGRSVVKDLPGKDTHWGRRYFYFEVNEHSVVLSTIG